ncbi:hypothetical protein BD779DRAFT_1475362 [Infundibulicybe gibba]|nr:hypothetical protein BD779DRAFT_1475362 [Infundibulicybe gibba]
MKPSTASGKKGVIWGWVVCAEVISPRNKMRQGRIGSGLESLLDASLTARIRRFSTAGIPLQHYNGATWIPHAPGIPAPPVARRAIAESKSCSRVHGIPAPLVAWQALAESKFRSRVHGILAPPVAWRALTESKSRSRASGITIIIPLKMPSTPGPMPLSQPSGKQIATMPMGKGKALASAGVGRTLTMAPTRKRKRQSLGEKDSPAKRATQDHSPQKVFLGDPKCPYDHCGKDATHAPMEEEDSNNDKGECFSQLEEEGDRLSAEGEDSEGKNDGLHKRPNRKIEPLFLYDSEDYNFGMVAGKADKEDEDGGDEKGKGRGGGASGASSEPASPASTEPGGLFMGNLSREIPGFLTGRATSLPPPVEIPEIASLVPIAGSSRSVGALNMPGPGVCRSQEVIDTDIQLTESVCVRLSARLRLYMYRLQKLKARLAGLMKEREELDK